MGVCLWVGLLLPANDNLAFFVAAEVGISRLENVADYRGPLSESILAPVADGIIFNWDTNARLASLTGGLDYRQNVAEVYELGLTARYTFSHIASYSESRDLPSFSENTGTVSAKLDFKHPFNVALGDMPLFGIVHGGATAFTGENRDALGFTHFYEIGYSVGLDVSAHNRYLESFHIGYQLNSGREVDGYSVLLGWTLK